MAYHCEYCGQSSPTINGLTAGSCARHPSGSYRGKHSMYQGGQKSSYSCKFCGQSASSISSLTAGTCARHPMGTYKGKHAPAL